MGILSKLFGGGNDQLSAYISNGAVIVDVRTPQEFSQGSVNGAKNMPLQSIGNKVDEITKWKKPVILCCASGMRSGQATKALRNSGIDCINGGSWQKVDKALKQAAS
ncbi:MAG: rhodanese-like domain-containing protein [Bacteroidota bacterium]